MSVMPDFNDLLDDLINGTTMNESVDDDIENGELETEAATSARKSFPAEGAPSSSAVKGVKDPVGVAEEACKGGKGCGTTDEACAKEAGCQGPNKCGGKGGCAKEEVDPMMDASDVASLLATEGDDEDDDDDEDDEKEGLSIDDLEDDEDDDDEDEGPDEDEFEGLEGLSDSELDSLARDLGDGEDCEDGECEEIRLDPNEERRADDLMQIAGTASLIRSEMNAEERTALLESADDLRIGMVEGFFCNATLNDLQEMVESVSLEEEEELLTEAKMYNKTTVRFSKQARLNQLFAIAVTTSARAHNDSDYVRYKKASIIKKKYWRKLCQKYKSEAMKRMRVLFARLRSSKSPIVKKLGQKVDASNANIASVANQNK